MKTQRVFVVGGTGFVGRHLLYHLSRLGMGSRVAVRRPHRVRDLDLIPGCEVLATNWSRSGLAQAMRGCTAIISLAASLSELRGQGLGADPVAVTQALGEAALDAGVKRLIHLGALGAAETAPSGYLRTNWQAEQALRGVALLGLAVTYLRPAPIFGPDDRLLTRIAALIRLSPFGLVILPCPETRIAPVYVGDVTRALVRCLEAPETLGQVYELCGPRVFSLRDLVLYTARRLGRRIHILQPPEPWALRLAGLFERLPGGALGVEDYRTLQAMAPCRSAGLRALGVRPTDLEAVVPSYL